VAASLLENLQYRLLYSIHTPNNKQKSRISDFIIKLKYFKFQLCCYRIIIVYNLIIIILIGTMASSLRKRHTRSSAAAEEEEERSSLATTLLQQTIRDNGQNYDDDNAGPSLADIDRSMRYGSLYTVVAWLALVATLYSYVDHQHYERLEGAERITAIIAFGLLSVNLAVRTLPLLLPTGGAFLFDAPTASPQYASGIVIGGVTTQLIAIFTDGAMAFTSVPVLVDPILGQRVSLLRWAEFCTLAFLVTFLTEVFGVRDKDKRALSIPLIHALCQGLSTAVGLLFPYCTSKKVWYTLLAISCSLFSVIFPRLHYKQQAFSSMKTGRTFHEAILYDRARLSLKMLKACTICWTLFPVVFFMSGFILPALVPPSSLWRNPAIPMVCEAALDVICKLVQMNVIMDVHCGVFDDPDSVRALQRLVEVKDAIGEQKWATAHDVIIISVRQFSGNVTSMVSPADYLFDNKNNTTNNTTTKSKDSLVFSLGYEHFNSIQQQQLAEDHAVRPIIVTGTSPDDATKLGSLGGLVVRAWHQTKLPRATLQHTVVDMTCQAEVTRLEEHLMVIVVQGLE
jgi:hypothetical protein